MNDLIKVIALAIATVCLVTYCTGCNKGKEDSYEPAKMEAQNSSEAQIADLQNQINKTTENYRVRIASLQQEHSTTVNTMERRNASAISIMEREQVSAINTLKEKNGQGAIKCLTFPLAAGQDHRVPAFAYKEVFCLLSLFYPIQQVLHIIH